MPEIHYAPGDNSSFPKVMLVGSSAAESDTLTENRGEFGAGYLGSRHHGKINMAVRGRFTACPR